MIIIVFVIIIIILVVINSNSNSNSNSISVAPVLQALGAPLLQAATRQAAADPPSGAFRDIPKAQCTFRSDWFTEIMQFTLPVTLRCALHRCSSRDIRARCVCAATFSGQLV